MRNQQDKESGLILVVEDDNALREAFKDTLEIAGYSVLEAENAGSALRLLERFDVDMMVSDVNMPGMDGVELLKKSRQLYKDLPVLLVTAYASIAKSVAAMQAGAVDYLVKPFEPPALLEQIANHVVQPTRSAEDWHDRPIAADSGSRRVLKMAERVADTDVTIMITGSSGTGKEVLARYIHTHSRRRDKPFVAVNCAAIPENMLEAMLFGYEKGAFTGAYQSAAGKFEQANGGTLLLDEVSEMDVSLQAKLLRVLQEREVERLGGKQVIKLDTRVVATSNRNLRQSVAAGDFREDLFYRLNVFPLHWQALRDRPDDIIPIAEKLLQQHSVKFGRPVVRFDSAAKKVLQFYSWPGNIRELDNVVQRALILQPGQLVTANDICLDIESYSEGARFNAANDSFSRKPTVSSQDASVSDVGGRLGANLKEHEFEMIAHCLEKHANNRQKTAKELGISERTLRYKLAKMRENGLETKRYSA